MKEFGFLNNASELVILGDEIDVVEEGTPNSYLISNSKKLDAEIYAPEINFYLTNTDDEILEQAKNVSLLYEARAICFDKALDMDYEKEVGNNVIIVSETDKTILAQKLNEAGFKAILLSKAEVKFIYGEVGELYISILRENDEFEVKADFFLVENGQEYMLRQSGCYEIANLSDEEIIQNLKEKSPKFPYKISTTYDSTICQYHQRRSEHCGKCADACPTVSILKDDSKKELVFSHIDCISCGNCVGVCPSGAMDYARMPSGVFHSLAKLYEDKIALIVPRKSDVSACRIKLPKNVLPFATEGGRFLTETHFMTLLQESGGNVIFYAKIIGDGTKEAIRLVNEIYKAKFNKTAIFIAHDEKELQEALNTAEFIPNSKFSLNEYAMAKREIFSKRVAYLVGDEDLGKTTCGEWVRYGTVSINQDSCTLCLSCVGACNVGALYADKSDNSIKFNASLCTTCGYCETSCAEQDTIKLTRSGMELRPKYFAYQELAKDTLFKCIECGKEFATTKSILKIAGLMGSKFIDDPYKAKTLYCCADCKAKLMILKQIEDGDKLYE